MEKILVCDDNFDILNVIKILLELKGYAVVTTSSGKECIEKALEINPDFIFLDVMMPGMDGWKTLRELRKIEGVDDLPICMLTVRDLTLEVYRSDDMVGLVNYIHKPFMIKDLLETLEEFL